MKIKIDDGDKNLLLNFSPLLIVVIFGFAMAFLNGCSTFEPLEGLCYNDKDGTYLCPEPEEIEPMNEHEQKWNTCKPFIELDGESWANCMLIA